LKLLRLQLRLPVVLPTDEFAAVLQRLEGDQPLLAKLLDGIVLRLSQPRVGEVDFAHRAVIVRYVKDKDWVLMLPQT